MQNNQGVSFPRLSDSPESIAFVDSIRTIFFSILEAHKKEFGGPPSKSFFDVCFVMINTDIIARDYDTYWHVFQRAQKDYGYTSEVWNRAFRSKDQIDQKVVLKNWGAEPEILIVLQKIAFAATDFAKEDPSWKPMDLIIWSILTSMVDEDYHEPMMRDLVAIIDAGVDRVRESEIEAPLI
jgi:hypothetical protein